MPRPRGPEAWWLQRGVALVVGVAPIAAMMREFNTHTGSPGPMPGMGELSVIAFAGMASMVVVLVGFVTMLKNRDAGSLVLAAGLGAGLALIVLLDR